MTPSKPARKSEICFTSQHTDAFRAISGDRNPLHGEADYAKRTQFGRLVVHGMCNVLAALSAWAQGRPFELQSLRVKFMRPVFFGETYSVSIVEGGDGVKIETLKGNQAQAKASFKWRAGAPEPAGANPAGAGFQGLPVAKDWDGALPDGGWLPDPFPYSPDWSAEAEFARAFGLSPGQFPRHQLAALLWSSYFVGMEAPGKQALFVELDFSFEDPAGEAGFAIRGGHLAYDPKFRLVTISGRGTGIRAFRCQAFRRPEPVNYSVAEVRDFLGEARDFSGKTMFISGGCRGFGSVLARAGALRGVQLALNYRSSAVEAEDLSKELAGVGTDALLLPGDVASQADCERMRDQMLARFGKLDFLVCNACLPLEDKSFLAQRPEEFLDYLQRFVGLTTHLLHAFLPILEPGSTVVHISTIAVSEAPKQMSHYVAAKSAAEGLLRVLAGEFKTVRFVNARPPRMLTDATNLPYDVKGPVSAITVAGRLLEALQGLAVGRNYFEIDL